MNAVEVVLPGGFPDDAGWQRTATLRPFSGADEAYLADLPPGPPAARTTALLTRCLDRLGTSTAVTPDTVRELIVGDREALLLHLRRLAFGERLACVLPATYSSRPVRLSMIVTLPITWSPTLS